MKHILMVAPRSIPVYGAEEIVNLKLLKTLSKSNQFEIDLISRRNKHIDYPFDSKDTADVRLRAHHVIEADNRFTPEVAWQHFKALAKFGCVFRGAHWAAEALPVAEKLVVANDYDYILSKSESSFLIGYYIKKKYGLKWATTWNDPYPYYKCPQPYGKGPGGKSLFDRRIMKMLRTADIHVFPNSRLRDYVRSYIDIDIDRTRIAPHVIIHDEIKPGHGHPDDEALRLISSGNLCQPRDPRPFLSALQRLVTSNPDINIRMSILGVTDSNLPEFVRLSGLEKYVDILPPVSYGESLAALDRHDVALIFEAPCKEGIFLPTKVSDYMQSGVNIFAVSPRTGVLNDLYKDSKIGYFADVTDPDAIYSELVRLYSDFKSRSLFSPVAAREYLDKQITETYLNF